MTHIEIAPFYVIGFSIRTTNENGQSSRDIPELWNKFMSANAIAQIPNKSNEEVYCIYTDYEKDHTQPYTTILGCKVGNLNSIPDGMIGKLIKGGKYNTVTAKGKILEGIVFQEWIKIWNSDIPRAYTADFEIYGAKAQNPDDAEIDILVAVK